jgi:hypothetical protein
MVCLLYLQRKACMAQLKSILQELHLELKTLSLETAQTTKQIINELRYLSNFTPSISPQINTVLILSGRYTCLGNFAMPNGDNNGNRSDDYERIKLGIKIAKNIIEKRTCRSFAELSKNEIKDLGPRLVYNGTKQQNIDFKALLEKNTLFHNYPTDKFEIIDLGQHEKIGTKGQLLNLKDSATIKGLAVAIVTHVQHFPRLVRMLSTYLNPFSKDVVLSAFLVNQDIDEEIFKNEVLGEIKRIIDYSKTGDLADPNYLLFDGMS